MIDHVLLIGWLLAESGSDGPPAYTWVFLLSGLGFYVVTWSRYRNTDARHSYESETKVTKVDVVATDTKVAVVVEVVDESIKGRNDKRVNGSEQRLDGGEVLTTGPSTPVEGSAGSAF